MTTYTVKSHLNEEFKKTGLNQSVGWGNGYVILPKGHHLEMFAPMNIAIGVHGGVTFKNKVNSGHVEEYGLSRELIGNTILGFDTAHYGDTEETWTEEAVIAETEKLAELISAGEYRIVYANADTMISAVEKWGEERGFYDEQHGTNSEKQFQKLVEEVGEIAGDLARGRDVRDSIGDAVVVLIGLAKLNGTSINECLEHAYNEIKSRKGKMINGVFIKEEDLVK